MWWALKWVSENNLDGRREHIMLRDGLFPTRAKARAYRDERYGYIREREDLRREPHGWRLPKAVRVTVREWPE